VFILCIRAVTIQVITRKFLKELKYMSKALFNKISIVESLSPDDRKTGELLYDDIRMLEIFHQKGIEVEYVTISSKQELYEHIDKLIEEVVNHRLFPVLQLDLHGRSDKRGIALNSGETIIWSDFCNKLRELNELSNGNLVLVMAACYGSFVQGGIDLFNRSPFWAVMSPVEQVTPDDIHRSLGEFYRSIFEGQASPNNIPKHTSLNLITTDMSFLQFWKVYLDDKKPNDLLTQHAVKLHALAEKENNKIDIELIRTQLAIQGKQRLLNQLKYFLYADRDTYNIDKVKFNSSAEILDSFKDKKLYGE
jgi:hypothetical protein